jgi:hypothetical protein
MSIEEAAQIAHLFGQFSDGEFEKRGWPITHMYNDLSANVFNRYWENVPREYLVHAVRKKRSE